MSRTTAATTGDEKGNSTRVLIVSQFFPPEGIGGGYRWEQFATHLPADYECRVVCPPPTLPYGEFDRTFRPIQRDEVNGVPVTRLWTYQPPTDATADESNLHRVLNYGIFATLATLYVLVHVWRYDCVVTMSSPHTTFLPGLVGNLLGRPWIVDVYDRWLDNAVDFGYTERGSVIHRAFQALERRAMLRSAAVITITPTLASGFQEKYPEADPEKFTAVPFGVDESLFPPAPSAPRDPQVVYVGNLGEVHAFEPFMRAFARLPSDATFAFVGEGKRRDYLKSLASELGVAERVRFVGTVPRQEVADVLARSAASIVPLETDQHLDYACPTKLVETMAVGTPFVGSAVREITRVASESGSGFAVENDVDEITPALETLVTDPERREQLGHDGVAYVDAHHRWNVLTRRVEGVLEAAVTDSESPGA